MKPAHDTSTPDVETASAGYASRFSGPIGAFFLEVQQQLLLRLLDAPRGARLRILDVGGGHAQLTPALLAAGHDVVIQGSAPECAARVRGLVAQHPGRVDFVVSDLWSLPFAAQSFDAVVAVRLLAHVERYRELIAEMARVSRGRLIVDFPPWLSANLLDPLLFPLKRRLEGNTRPFFCYRTRALDHALASAGFRRQRIEKQFFLPMVVHRAAKARGLSMSLERGFRTLGLTAWLGGPALLAAEPLGTRR